MVSSLKDAVIEFGRKEFPKVFPSPFRFYWRRFLMSINSARWGLVVIPFTVICFLIGQIYQPAGLPWMHLTIESARTIVDQRASNLATIFSITLVVIGWLITNLAVKESISFKLLFKALSLYPIFYFVASLISCLVLSSLLRDEPFINLPNLVIIGSILIIIALALITKLFVNFTKVVDSAFLYDALGVEVMREVYVLARTEITKLKSSNLYNKSCEEMKFIPSKGFGTDLSNHEGVNITPLQVDDDQDPFSSFLNPKENYLVQDINTEKITSAFSNIPVTNTCYYTSLFIGSTFSENFCPFHLDSSLKVDKGLANKLRKALRLKSQPNTVPYDPEYLNYIHLRLKKDIKEGKHEGVQKGLAIYSQIFDLENEIFQKC